MTFKERNEMLGSLIDRYKTLHDLYTNSTKQLTDEQWDTYINQMEEITAKFNDTNLRDIAGDIQMAFLNDTEFIQKRLRKHEMHAQ